MKTLASTQPKHPHDHIATYFKEPRIPAKAVEAAGGYVKYWEAQKSVRPTVARMALAYITAPGMSILLTLGVLSKFIGVP